MKQLWRKWLPILPVTLLAAWLPFTPWLSGLQALSLDLLYLAHQRNPFSSGLPAEREPMAERESAVVVIAVDEASYRRPPLAGTPKVFWTRELAGVLREVHAAGAAVIALDLIFPTSVEPYLPGFERPFLLALRETAADGRLLLGKAQHSEQPVAPAPTQSFAVGHERNVRALNLVMDRDGVIRGHPLFFQTAEGGEETSMALELALRASGLPLSRGDDGLLRLGEWVIPVAGRDDRFLLNHASGRAVPAYSLADLLACIAAGERERLAAIFADKVVLIGTVLDLEDRWTAANRLAGTVYGGGHPTGCGDDFVPPVAEERRESMAGVFIHATAVDNLLFQEVLRPLPGSWLALAAGALVLVVALATLSLPPLFAATVLLLGGLLLLPAGVWLLERQLAFPFLVPLVEGGGAFVGLLAYRFALVDRQKMRIRRLFSLYTSPSLIEKMLADDRLPELGGEERQVTVWFSDLAGFTALAEGLRPAEVVRLMNRYLTEITDLVEEHGGFVDKYIGDAVLAIFGAPHADPEHAVKAVAAALAVQRRLAELAGGTEFMGRKMITRIGINTGPAMVGNIGSPRRFNYTVIGDTVNLASRLEGANKYLGSLILLSEYTAAVLPPAVVLREVETIRVKGRQAPLKVYEPLALERGELAPEKANQLQLHAEALALARVGDREAALQLLAASSLADPVTEALGVRLQEAAKDETGLGPAVHELQDK